MEENKNIKSDITNQNSSQNIPEVTSSTLNAEKKENIQSNIQTDTTSQVVNNEITTNNQESNNTASVNNTIKNQDLVIGEIKPEKEASPVIVIVLFAILLGFAIGLPAVSDYVTAYINSHKPIEQPIDNNGKPQDSEEETDESNLVELNNDTTIEIEGLIFKTFTFTTENNLSYINYQISPQEENSQLVDSLYIELFSSGNELLSRSKIYVKGYEFQDNILNLQSVVPLRATTEAKKIIIVSKEEQDIPEIELETGIDNKEKLVCVRNTHELTYTFQDYYLIEIQEKYTGIKGTDINAYTDNLAKYQRHILELEKIDGVSATLVTSDTGFTMNNIIDLGTAKIENVNYPSYFNPSTLAKVVKFDMEAMGYSCK